MKIDILFHIEDPAIINMVSDLFNDLEIKKISFKIIADGFASSRFQNHKELLKVTNISAEEIIAASLQPYLLQDITYFHYYHIEQKQTCL